MAWKYRPTSSRPVVVSVVTLSGNTICRWKQVLLPMVLAVVVSAMVILYILQQSNSSLSVLISPDRKIYIAMSPRPKVEVGGKVGDKVVELDLKVNKSQSDIPRGKLPLVNNTLDEKKLSQSSEIGKESSKVATGNNTKRRHLEPVEGLKDAMKKHNFSLVLNEPAACQNPAGGARNVFLLVLVMTTHNALDRRQALRETWASLGEVKGHAIVHLFLLGASRNPTLNELVRQESAQHHDLLMEDFQDTYRNLSLKTLMGLKWMATHCPQASYVLKTDHDVYIGLANLVSLLTRQDTPSQRFVTGHVFFKLQPARKTSHRHYMPRNVFSGEFYPPYSSGGAYVLSGDLPPLVFTKAVSLPAYIPIEDVMVGICLDALGVKPVHNFNFRMNFIPYSFCVYRGVLSVHGVSSKNMIHIWKEYNSNHTLINCP